MSDPETTLLAEPQSAVGVILLTNIRWSTYEAWRFDGQRIRFYRLDREGNYRDVEKSVAFPFLSAADLNRFLSRRASSAETRLMQDFRDWVRENLRTK
jgi:hypothetical protein